MSESKVTSKNDEADNKFKIQLRVVKKIIKNTLIISKHRFPEILIYQITKFVFKNPLRFSKTLYCRNTLNELKVNNQYLFRRTKKITQNQYMSQIQKAEVFSLGGSAKKDERQKEKEKVWVNKDKNTNENTAYITIVKYWKATIVNQNDYNQVLQKARLFFVFLSNVKIFTGKQIEKDNGSSPLTDFQNYQNKQKEFSKYHHLICDNFQLYYSYFQEIFKYQKNKKINAVVIKAFINLMSKNMALVKIQQNYNTDPLQCQSKYLYIESKHEVALKCKRATQQEQFPSLRIQRGQWIMVQKRENYVFEVFQEVTYPLPWGRNSYLTRYMTVTTSIDVWIQEGQ